MKLLFLAILILLVPMRGLAQEIGTLQGVVCENGTMHPVTEARVHIMSTGIRGDYKVETDSRGRFAHIGLRPGLYLVIVSKDGYAPIDVFDLIIEPGGTTWLDLTLTPADRAPFRRQLVRYRHPMINVESATIRNIIRFGI